MSAWNWIWNQFNLAYVKNKTLYTPSISWNKDRTLSGIGLGINSIRNKFNFGINDQTHLQESCTTGLRRQRLYRLDSKAGWESH